MVTIEKWQSFDVNTTDDEDAMVAVMKAVKSINPKTATYFYMNSFKDRPEMTRMARQLSEHPSWYYYYYYYILQCFDRVSPKQHYTCISKV